jgi:hypothetical protein
MLWRDSNLPIFNRVRLKNLPSHFSFLGDSRANALCARAAYSSKELHNKLERFSIADQLNFVPFSVQFAY